MTVKIKCPPKSAPDLVLRITLLRDQEGLKELSPSIWRQFRCSSAINLDVFQDKILQPIMGWTRNYHCYYFAQDEKCYYQNKMAAADAIVNDICRPVGGERLDPTEYTIGDLLKQEGDACFYCYDLGDNWYHKLICEQVIAEDEESHMNGKCLVLDGAMRCPDEDGKGAIEYQEAVLDLLQKTQSNPTDATIARQYAKECWIRADAINVSGLFEPDDFSVLKTQAILQFALRSRNPVRKGSKTITLQQEVYNPNSCFSLQPGQRKIRHFLQSNRKTDGRPGADPGFISILEVVNVKPDEDNVALCIACGTPHGLKRCSGCQTARYCSKSCQKNDWKKHKKECKHDKQFYEDYQKELGGKVKPPKTIVDGDRICHKKYDRQNMRFTKGTKVECRIGDDVWGTGKVAQVLHEYEGFTHAYQVQLDWKTANKMGWPYHSAQIWADWDCDYMIRKI